MKDEFITVEEYASQRIFKSVEWVLNRIKKHQPLKGVVNVFFRDEKEGYIIQYNRRYRRDPPKVMTDKEKKQKERERADYIIQKRKLEKRLLHPERWDIIPDYLYDINYPGILKENIFFYLKANVSIPGVEMVFRKATNYFLQMKRGYDFSNIPDNDMIGIINFKKQRNGI